jgi:hypothetical protein
LEKTRLNASDSSRAANFGKKAALSQVLEQATPAHKIKGLVGGESAFASASVG